MLTKNVLACLLALMVVSAIFSYRIYVKFLTLDIKTLPRRPMPSVKSNFGCENVMTNLTNGRWVHWTNFVIDFKSKEYKKLELEEKRFDEHLTEFRIERGIHTKMWRDDLKCGFKNHQSKPAGKTWGGTIGAWCDAKSDYPCCSDENNGKCGMRCDCESCIDMRKIIHAEFAKWVPDDARCGWKNYTAKEACKVVRKFSEIHIVGDSFIRKMGRVMISMLRGDRNLGATYKKHDKKMRKKCVGDDQLYWTECRFNNGTYKELLVDESPLCGMDLSKFVLHSHYVNDAGEKALKLVKNLLGKPGSLILLSVGAHLSCLETDRTFKTNLLPIVDVLATAENAAKSHAARNGEPSRGSVIQWPLVIFMFPDMSGVLKSPEYLKPHGRVSCSKFSNEMIDYLTHVGIPYLDFRKVTTNVHSYDGTHYGIGVYVQKLQILFNYLESLDWLDD